MTVLINASNTSGLTFSSDTSGNVAIQSNGTTVATISGSGANAGIQMGSTFAPAFSVYLNANQSITSAVQTKVNFNTEIFDTANCFNSSSTYRFTPTVAGYYQFNWYLQTVNSTTTLISFLVKNGDANGPIGSVWRGSRVDVSGTVASTGSTLVYLNGTTDYAEVYGYIGGASAGFIGSSVFSDACYFNGFLARSA